MAEGKRKGGLRVVVFGAAGYVGGELLRLLAGHPQVEKLVAISSSHPGERVGAVHPALAHALFELSFASLPPAEAAAGADVVFLAWPHGEAQERIGEVLEADPPLVVDLAADFRVRDLGLYEEHYGAHAAPEINASFRYALADDEGDALRGARRLAAPGCFATATLLALRPLARAGLLEGAPTSFAVTGSTGSGAKPKRTTHHPVRAHNYFGYGAGGHRHEAEIDDRLRSWSGDPAARCRLVPHSAPIVRGIHATLHARLSSPLADPLALLRSAWEHARFVRVLDAPPELAAIVGTNYAHTFAATRAGGREALVYVAIDNLVKGAAGQALQAMNLALGLDEAAGLGFAGLYPC